MAAAGRDPGGERRLEHLAGLARVAHDQNLRVLAGDVSAAARPSFEGELGGQELARHAADPVGPEQRHAAC